MARVTLPDIDRILEAIRTEARARRSTARAGAYSGGALGADTRAESHGIQQPEAQHVADYLALPLDTFMVQAYRASLGRDPDPAGAAHYQRMMLRGRISRVELLGRLAFSPESRRRGVPRIPGVGLAFIFALAYRVPLVGALAAWLVRAARLPAHLQDRSAIEAAALASGTWMKR